MKLSLYCALSANLRGECGLPERRGNTLGAIGPRGLLFSLILLERKRLHTKIRSLKLSHWEISTDLRWSHDLYYINPIRAQASWTVGLQEADWLRFTKKSQLKRAPVLIIWAPIRHPSISNWWYNKYCDARSSLHDLHGNSTHVKTPKGKLFYVCVTVCSVGDAALKLSFPSHKLLIL